MGLSLLCIHTMGCCVAVWQRQGILSLQCRGYDVMWHDGDMMVWRWHQCQLIILEPTRDVMLYHLVNLIMPKSKHITSDSYTYTILTVTNMYYTIVSMVIYIRICYIVWPVCMDTSRYPWQHITPSYGLSNLSVSLTQWSDIVLNVECGWAEWRRKGLKTKWLAVGTKWLSLLWLKVYWFWCDWKMAWNPLCRDTCFCWVWMGVVCVKNACGRNFHTWLS